MNLYCYMSMVPVFMRANHYLNRKTGLPSISPHGYVLSEKYDGQRAQWDVANQRLISRSNIVIPAPKRFLEYLQDIDLPLDGELYLGYGTWDLTGIFRSGEDVETSTLWKRAVFMVFDIADPTGLMGTYETRRKKLDKLFRDQGWSDDRSCPIKLVPIKTVDSTSDVKREFDEVIKRGGEGIMLNNIHALYQDGKTNALLKYKTVMDEEAVIVAYKLGHTGKMGSFVAYPIDDGKIQHHREFSIAGLTTHIKANYQRMFPLGTVISYKCTELSKTGKPKHPVLIGKCSKVVTQLDMILCKGRLDPAKLPKPTIKATELVPANQHQLDETEALRKPVITKAPIKTQEINNAVVKPIKPIKPVIRPIKLVRPIVKVTIKPKKPEAAK